MKRSILSISLPIMVIAIFTLSYSCKKKTTSEHEPEPIVTTPETFTSLQDFYTKYGPTIQTFTLNASVGGTFVTTQATTISIPANVFINASSVTVTGTVAIEFMDIYKKSDMLLAKAGTITFGGPLESAGEFYIKAVSNSQVVALIGGKKITIKQPVQPLAVVNFSMAPFVGGVDSVKNVVQWFPNPNDSILALTSQYVFSLYSFSGFASSGTWCNSDNQGYFNAYTKTWLNLLPASTTYTDMIMDVFLVFKNVNSMIHVYKDACCYALGYTYQYAPVGLQATVVAVGVRGGKLYSSFTPITISTMQQATFTFTETNSTDFQNAVKALN